MIVWYCCSKCDRVFTKVIDANHNDTGNCSFCHTQTIKRVRFVHSNRRSC